MITLKTMIAGFLVCFKPSIFITICCILILIRLVVEAIMQAFIFGWQASFSPSTDTNRTVTPVIIIFMMLWLWFCLFSYMFSFGVDQEMESILLLLQCSKRGFRLLGVVSFHLVLFGAVALLTASLVGQFEGNKIYSDHEARPRHHQQYQRLQEIEKTGLRSDGNLGRRLEMRSKGRVSQYRSLPAQRPSNRPKSDIAFLVTIYQMWMTAIIYCFTYLIIENVVMYYTDLNLIEFIHFIFLFLVARITGMDLSDNPAGEMRFNPLVRRRLV